MESKKVNCKNLNTGRKTTGKRPYSTVWGKLMICECGHRFALRKWDRKNGVTNPAYQCYDSVRTGSYESRKKRGLPLDGICQTPMIPEWKLQMMANYIFRNFLADKQKVLELANSMLEAHIDDDDKAPDNTPELLEQKNAELEKLGKKIDNYVEMRSDGEISKDTFRTKVAELEKRVENLKAEIATLSESMQEEPEVKDYSEKLTVLRYALEQYTDFKEDEAIPPSVIEAFVIKIVVHKDGFDWYLRFDGDPNDPLHCRTTGKRKTTTQIFVEGGNSPSADTGYSGCYSRQALISSSECLYSKY